MNLQLTKPGLFITATDTEVGKTVVTAAIATLLHDAGLKVGVCKPVASGCRRVDGELVSDDAEALKACSGSALPLSTINPVRYAPPLAPAQAAELERCPVDDGAIAAALSEIDGASDVVLIESIGGILVPLDDRRTVLDLARTLGYPVLVVARTRLGTLNHTALTCTAVRHAGLRLAGVVLNGLVSPPDDAQRLAAAWIKKQNGVDVLATLPQLPPFDPRQGVPHALLRQLSRVAWSGVCRRPMAG